MVCATLAMYSLATAHVGLSLRQNLIAFFDQKAADGGRTILNDQGDPLVYSQITIEIINVSAHVPVHPLTFKSLLSDCHT